MAKKKEPKHVGTWVICTTVEGELIQWGEDGSSDTPYPPDDIEARKQAEFLINDKEFRDDNTLYIMHVFDNGQIKTFAFES